MKVEGLVGGVVETTETSKEAKMAGEWGVNQGPKARTKTRGRSSLRSTLKGGEVAVAVSHLLVHCLMVGVMVLTSVDDGRSGLIVLLLGDPHLLEGGERGEDRSSDPDRVLPLGGGDNLDLHRRRRERGDLLLHSVG